MYQQTDADKRYGELMDRVQQLDPRLSLDLDETIGERLSEAQDLAIKDHGQQIFALIEGTTYLPTGAGTNGKVPSDSPVVRLIEGAAS